jgi:catechol 2,3-dioxygenase-like lactoylglutathione lyase family enzyme
VAETKSSTKITDIGVVMVPVSDQDKAVEFYIEKLGFEKRSDTPYGEGQRWIEMGPPGGEVAVALVNPRPGDPVGVELPFGFNTEDADADHAELKERGVDVDDEVLRMGDPAPPMFFFRDQDGNSILIVQRGGY